MSKIVQFLINGSHHAGGNKFIYTFPSGKSLKLNDSDSIALVSASFYNCVYNIKKSWYNNKFVILSNSLNINASSLNQSFVVDKGNVYTDPATLETINKKYITIELADGYYGIDELNLYFENILQQIGLYMESTTEDASAVHFIQAMTNPTKYGCQINLYLMPSTTPSGFMLPSNACFTLPSTPETLSLYFPVVNSAKYGGLSNIFGFRNATLLPLNNNINEDSYNLSTITPTVNPIQSYIICCNLINNELTNPPDILSQISLDAKFGAIVKYSQQPEYISTTGSNSSSIIITLFDEKFNEIELLDNQMSMIIGIKFYKEKNNI